VLLFHRSIHAVAKGSGDPAGTERSWMGMTCSSLSEQF
jgi:hypothetical protein